MTAVRTSRRWASAAVLIVLGGALSAAVWVGGDHGFALGMFAFYVLAGGIAYIVAGGHGDFAAIMRTNADERQRALDVSATRWAAYAMGLVGIAGTVVQSARGDDPGGYAMTCTVGGVAYSIALAWLSRRS